MDSEDYINFIIKNENDIYRCIQEEPEFITEFEESLNFIRDMIKKHPRAFSKANVNKFMAFGAKYSLNKSKSHQWLEEWVYHGSKPKSNYHDLPVEFERHFHKGKYVKDSKLIVYRGFNFSNKGLAKGLLRLDPTVNYANLKKGSVFHPTFDKLTSWSTNLRVATNFAKHNISSSGESSDYGIILETAVDPIDIVADIPITSKKWENHDYHEDEIVLKPGRYRCKIKDIMNLTMYNPERIDKALKNKEHLDLYKDILNYKKMWKAFRNHTEKYGPKEHEMNLSFGKYKEVSI